MELRQTVIRDAGGCVLKRGDIVRSDYGRIERLIVDSVAGQVVVLTPAGKIDSIPCDGIRRYWRRVECIAPKEEERWAALLEPAD